MAFGSLKKIGNSLLWKDKSNLNLGAVSCENNQLFISPTDVLQRYGVRHNQSKTAKRIFAFETFQTKKLVNCIQIANWGSEAFTGTSPVG